MWLMRQLLCSRAGEEHTTTIQGSLVDVDSLLGLRELICESWLIRIYSLYLSPEERVPLPCSKVVCIIILYM